MSTTLQLLGPIATGEDFMITSISYDSNYQPHVLTLGVAGATANNYVQVDLYNYVKVPGGTAGIFFTTGTESGMTFYDTANSCYLNVDSNNNLISSNTGAVFNLTQSTGPYYQPWNDPDVFLGNVTYQINVIGASGAIGYALSDINSFSYPVTLEFQVLPTTFYYNLGGTCASSSSAIDTLATWACSMNSDANVGFTCGNAITGVTMGFTTQSDCQAGIEYLYCPTGDYCGTLVTNKTCNGPCNHPSQNCINMVGDYYICEGGLPPQPPPFELLGPISTSDTFMIVSEIGSGQAYALTLGIVGATANNYVQVDLYNWFTLGIPVGGVVGVFSVSETKSGITFYDTANSCYLNVDSNNNLVSSSTTGAVFNLTQSTGPYYQTWNSPTVFLANVTYEINVIGTGAAEAYSLSNTNGLQSPNPLQFQALESTFYYNSSGTCIPSGPAINALATWACSINIDSNVGFDCFSAIAGISGGFTNLSDCQNDIIYSYCPEGNYCGNNNCNGPCKNLLGCDLSGSKYVCAFPPLPPPAPPASKSFYQTPIFIGIIVAVGVIIIILAIVFIILHNKKDSQENS